MKKEEEEIHLKIKRRKWYEWLLWGLWGCFIVFFFQNTLASQQEYEPRAAILYAMILIILVLGGVIIWFVRRNQPL